MKKPVAININFDSINENIGFPKNFRDPSFFKVFDRFIEYSEKYNFKYSIYIIGKDLENPEIAARVKEWSIAGHEIGNHSYSHRLNIGGLKEDVLRDEIGRSHDLISNCTEKEPVGFICPGWSTSKKVVAELIRLKYLYDTSLFPSYLIYPATFKNALNHIKRFDKFKEIISRRDYLFPISKPLTPFFADANFKVTSINNAEKIVMLPLPTLNRSMSLWHTLFFIFGANKTQNKLKDFLNNYDYLYYLMHPADLTSLDDLEADRLYTIERMDVSIQEKHAAVIRAFDLIKASQRPIVTMKELALNFINEEVTRSVEMG